MEPVFIPKHELFIILEPFRRRFRTIYRSLEPLADAANEGPLLLGADAYYRAETDVALLAIRFDARTMSDRKLTWVLALCADSHLPVLDPERLGEQDRRSFYEGYLPIYELRIEQCDGPEAALCKLASELRIDPPRTLGPPAGYARAAETTARRRSRSAPPDTVAAPVPAPSAPRARSAVPPPLPPEARGKEKKQPRKPTVPASPTARRPLPDPQAIHARFLRGDEWVNARLRSISLRGAGVVTGALPRLRDNVQLAVAYEDCGAVLEGLVVELSGQPSPSGASGFRLAFPEEDSPARRRLLTLLRRARFAGVSLAPPPRRAAVRMPVRWPIRVSDQWSDVPAAALDVSERGLFLATERGLEDEVAFQLPLDEAGRPVKGRARVARQVGARMAGERGLFRGFGLEILDLVEEDVPRWRGFLERVRRRSERRVAVGAAEGRRKELTGALAMAGYAACGRQDPTSTLELVDEGNRPPDAVVLDASMVAGRDSRWLRSAIEKRGVPCIALREERPAQARSAVDRVLSVVH